MSVLYGAAASWRRQWYTRHPDRRYQLERPVISVGNLRVGGSGKTPVVQTLARLLIAEGERPCVLSRGYGRAQSPDGVTVVSDGQNVLAGVESAGDEPLMLARALPSVPVLVGGDRYLSGRFAEDRLGVSVHLLDDGFQHFALQRDVDVLVAAEADLVDRPMPAGRLREPLAAAAHADAALIAADDLEQAKRVGHLLGVQTVFRVERTLAAPRWAVPQTASVISADLPSYVVSGIARPERFLIDLRAAGWNVVGSMPFRDHHRFTPGDLVRIGSAARRAGAALVVTTEKDAVRLPGGAIDRLPLVVVPLTIAIEPLEPFERWLRERIVSARTRRRSRESGRLSSGGPVRSSSRRDPDDVSEQ